MTNGQRTGLSRRTETPSSEVAARFRERAARADVSAALALLKRLGTEPPRPGDEIKAPEGESPDEGLRLAQGGRRA